MMPWPQEPYERASSQPAVSKLAPPLAMALLAVVLASCAYLQPRLHSLLEVPLSEARWQFMLGLGVVGSGLMFAAHELCKLGFADYRQQRRSIARALGALSRSRLIALGVLAAVAEELLLRGVLPPMFGLAGLGLVLASAQVVSRGQVRAFLFLALMGALLTTLLAHYSGSLLPGMTLRVLLYSAFLWRVTETPAYPKSP